MTEITFVESNPDTQRLLQRYLSVENAWLANIVINVNPMGKIALRRIEGQPLNNFSCDRIMRPPSSQLIVIVDLGVAALVVAGSFGGSLIGKTTLPSGRIIESSMYRLRP